MPQSSTITKYGLPWDAWLTPLQIEFMMIQQGGQIVHNGQTYGNGLFYHYREAQSLCWPTDDHHRWSDLMLKTILEQRLTVVMGARDSSKTYTFSKFSLIDYWAFPTTTLILMSSTDLRGLELRVWGNVKDLFQRARDLHDWLPGNVVDGKHGIFTDELMENGDVRDIRKGILCIPCLGSQGEWSGGLEKFLGIKQKRRRLIGDELQFMPLTYLNCLSNLDKGDFKAGFCGNPLGPGNPLDKVAEPVAGWDSLGEVTKTSTWKNRFDGVTIDLVGWDSPNFDSPEDKPTPYPYLIDRNDVKRVVDRYGKDSMQFWSQIAGVRKAGINAHCVLTRELCLQHDAFKQCIWSGEETTKVYGIDAGYGGDLCIGIMIEFGKDVTGQQVVKFFPPTIIPVQMSIPESPEDQIANFAKAECHRLGIPDENVFVEAGMRATLIVSMSRIMSSRINAVNFGGAATDRPVSNDLFIYDEKTRTRRLKRCNEHYSKFVSEIWFSVRALVESNQCRELPEAVADEFYLREWRFVTGDRYELETKAECKERTGFSPNNADAAGVSVEGARRLGFVIERIPTANEATDGRDDWLNLEVEKHKRLVKTRELTYD